MQYYKNIVFDNNFNLSCDKLRLKFVFTDDIVKQFNNFVDDLSLNDYRYNFKVYHSLSNFSYRYLLVFTYDDSVVQVGLGFNGIKKEDMHNCFIEFNPNKTLVNDYVSPILDFVKCNSIDLDLVRFDCAIDIPFDRSFVFLNKDNRYFSKVHKIEQSASNLSCITEYLGQRNNNGFVKLYNKTIESKLSYPLTRLEITLDSFSYDNFIHCLPIVYYIKNIDFNVMLNLTQTDRVMLMLLYNCDSPVRYLNMLGRDKKEKFKKLLFDRVSIMISEQLFFRFCCLVKSIYN